MMTFEEWKLEAEQQYHNHWELPSVPNFLQWCWNSVVAAERKRNSAENARLREALEAIVAYRQEIRDACYDLDNDLMARGESVAANICAATAKAALSDTAEKGGVMELAKYIKGVREFHREMGYPIRDYTIELMVDAWHKATKAERERCAGKCDDIFNKWRKIAHNESSDFADGIAEGSCKCAAAIREGDDDSD